MSAHNGVQYAATTFRSCPMHEDACAARIIEQIATFYPSSFDATALVEQACGRFARGAHKGQLRGWASIEVVTEGGWRRAGPGEGHGRVLYPGRVVSVRVTDFHGNAYLNVP